MDYNRFDLDDIARDLGEHFNKRDIPSYTAKCTVCGEELSQRIDKCPVCGTPTVWFHSKIWRELYGNPKIAASLLELVQPTSRTGEELCIALGLDGFRSKAEDKDWAKAERALGMEKMRGIIKYVTGTKNVRGRAGLSFAMNIARKRYDERPKLKKQEEVKQPHTAMW